MNYAEIKNCDIANGPGVRVSLFVSGCTHHCPGCFNRVTWDFNYGEPFTQDTIDHIINLMAPSYIKGLTVLGGEPFEPQNQPWVLGLLLQVRARYPEKSIWVFTGYLFDRDLASSTHPVTQELLGQIDVIVDGPFILEQRNLGLRFRGSDNQRIINVPESLKTDQVVLWSDA